MKFWNKSERGVTLTEMLVTVVVLGVISAIAMPLIVGNFESTYKAIAQEDARKVGIEVSTEMQGYTTFGSANGTISIVGKYLEISPMTSAYPNPSGPGGGRIIATLSPESTLTGTYGAGNGLKWCVKVVNREKVGIYTSEGAAPKSASTCNPDGSAA
jgi:prepilin-type N-terminal cleavage/methylation domain-containing protein